MRFDCYLSPECGSEEGLRENIRQASEMEKVKVDVSFYRIDDEAAVTLRFFGEERQATNAEAAAR